MTRKECLDKAAECVLKDRQNQYGKPEDCFGMIARMWGAYLGVCVSAHDVAAMMALLKIARFRHNPFHEDNAVDCAGYAACMVETATAWEREGEVKAEGCEELVQKDAPQTPEEVCQRIMDANPEIYKRRDPWEGLTRLNFKPPFELHKATGEELAEMAEEEGNA